MLCSRKEYIISEVKLNPGISTPCSEAVMSRFKGHREKKFQEWRYGLASPARSAYFPCILVLEEQNMVLSNRFEAGSIEEKWIQVWEEKGLFHVPAEEAKDPYTIMIPPPNVTGALHMGHALNNTIQDIVARYQRLQGKDVLWLPGTDHAGIATQAVVEKKLYREEGKKRKEMGREAFLAEVWKWKEEYGDRILGQLRSLGCSCDWERTRFTMDEGLSRAVRKSFVALWEKDLIYRGERLINWDCRLQTAVSDDEIEQSEVKGNLWYIRYPVKEQEGRYLTVATTRPETLFGDTGVAVHPEDPRFGDLVGQHVIVPVIGRAIPIVADDTVDPEFGTGAVKVTPAHDPNDYERGMRHKLPMINVLNKDGTLNAEAGPLAGIERLEARPKLIEMLEESGQLEKVEEHIHNVPHSDRSKTPIEPMISLQWFVDMKSMAQPAIAAVKADGTGKKEIEFVPARWEKVYLSWLENVRDWCISRQLWWGHRIPVWYDEDGNAMAFEYDPEPGTLHPESGKPLVRQDEDVLDTWASSWLWPFSTLGWPDDTPELEKFYTTQFLATGRDIIYLWVARMVMASYAFLEERPFDYVYINANVLDAKGRRMSKSAGNGVDPLEMIDEWGCDAVRFTLPLLTSEGQDIKLAPTKFEMGRNFCNKLWNACRFVLINLEDFEESFQGAQPGFREELLRGEATWPEDRFIEGKRSRTIGEVQDRLERFRFNEAATLLYKFVWDELCDWYLEIAKERLYGGRGGAESKLATQVMLVRTMRDVLTMLHPFTPFITEEIWSALKPYLKVIEGDAVPECLSEARWPVQTQEDAEALERFELLKEVTRAIRAVRAQHHIERKAQLKVGLETSGGQGGALLADDEISTIMYLCGLETFDVGPNVTPAAGASTTVLQGGHKVHVDLTGLVEFEAEIARIDARLAKLEGELGKLKGKLSNENYVSRAPAAVVQKDRDRLTALDAEMDTLRDQRKSLEALV